MVYGIYIDVLFLVNFFMDYIIILFIWRVLHCDTSHIRVVVGAVLGAAMYCLLILLPIPNPFLEFVIFHTIVNVCMIYVGLKINSRSQLCKALILMYIGTFFMGGILESLYQYVKVGSIFLVFAIAGYYLALGMWKILSEFHRHGERFVRVELYHGVRKVEITALYDTGNQLRDSITAKPISILDKKVARDLLGECMPMVRYVPYQSIGKRQGVIPIISVDKMCVLGEEHQYFEKILIGISEEPISANGSYNMILNPGLF